MLELNKIYCGDCLEIMKEIDNKSIDLILTDPPYGKKSDKGTGGFGSSKNRRYADNWDSVIPIADVFNEIFRISRNQIIFGGNYFNLPISNCWLVWDKKGDIAFKNPFADCELIWTSFKKPIKKYLFKQQGFIRDSKDKIYHPTQKPTGLFQRILEDFSNENDIIFDPFIGSGTTAVACKLLDRNFIGIEINPDYVDIANKRLANTYYQTELIK